MPNLNGPARTLEDALNATRSVGASLSSGLAENASLLKRLEQAALRVDPVIDAAAINAGMPDDALQHAAKKRQKQSSDMSPGGVNALFNATNSARQNYQDGLSFVGIEQQQKPVPKPPAAPNAFEQGMDLAEKGLGYAVFAPIATDMVLPTVGGIAGKIGFKGVESTLNAPKNFIQKTQITKNLSARQAMNDGIQLGFNFFQTYGVVKGFWANMQALKEMYADITGKDANSISTMTMLTSSNLPPLVAEARGHFIKEFGARGLIQLAGWGLVARDLIRGKHLPAKDIEAGRIGIAAGIVPGVVGMGVDMMMGTATTEVYSGFKKAFDAGQEIPANDYAAFLLASNADLGKRRIGKQVAMELGAEYAQEKAAPGEILRQMNDGRFKARVDALIARDEAALAQQTAAKAEKAAEPATKMVDKIAGVKPERAAIGKFTGMLSEEAMHRPGRVT